ncbi:hypothetical protein CLU79DRAFT_738282 [Phycomyces nitens]|nr:hypothetical protein CLU79DRAFT_738282 [Phycomyces nitens]
MYSDQAILILQKRMQRLNGDLLAQKAEYQTLFTEFHENVKHIRATDDDLSTIQKNLSNIQTKIANLSMNLKKHLNPDTAKVNEFLLEYWGNTLPNLKYLMKKNLNGSSEFEYGIINLLVEKMITDTIVQEVYNVPIYLGLPINAHYAALSEWKPFCETKDWSLRLREQLCFLAAKPEITASLKHKRENISKVLIGLLYQLYPTMGLREQDKIRSFVDLAAENSLAMHSQKIPVICMKLKEGQDKLQDGMKVQYGSAENATTIQVVVSPPFIGNEGQESSRCVLLEAKVICVDFLGTPPLDPFVDEPPQIPKE